MVSPQNHYEMWLYSVKVNYIKGPSVDSGGGGLPRDRCGVEGEVEV